MDRRQEEAYAMASADIGLREVKGPRHSTEIVQMFADVGHSWVKDDETAWCAAFVGAMLERAGLPSTRKLNARSYTTWGEAVALDDAKPGDVVVFSRGDPNGWQGHVGFFVRRAGTHIEVLGGNQSDQVSIARYPVSRMLDVRRWPHEPLAAPAPQAPKGLTAIIAAIVAAIRAIFRRQK